MSVAARLPLLFLGMLSLVIGILAGLARLAITMPPIATAQMGGHGALMISAFLGTVISLERAVALARRWPYLAPLCAGLGGLAMICGLNPMATQAFSIAGGLVLLAGALQAAARFDGHALQRVDDGATAELQRGAAGLGAGDVQALGFHVRVGGDVVDGLSCIHHRRRASGTNAIPAYTG